jgi:hypothetical protein
MKTTALLSLSAALSVLASSVSAGKSASNTTLRHVLASLGHFFALIHRPQLLHTQNSNLEHPHLTMRKKKIPRSIPLFPFFFFFFTHVSTQTAATARGNSAANTASVVVAAADTAGECRILNQESTLCPSIQYLTNIQSPLRAEMRIQGNPPTCHLIVRRYHGSRRKKSNSLTLTHSLTLSLSLADLS